MSCTCRLCPNNCKIVEGAFGVCGTRKCTDGKLELPLYGKISAASIDPIEKKPLYHFYPGSSIFSVGFYGCSLSCPFCQNYQISKEFKSLSSESLSPEEIVDTAISRGSFGIAYTYSEPIVHFEWVIEASKDASAKGLKNVLVTNGYINQRPGAEILDCIDAVNIDLKSFNDDFYRCELGGRLKPVLDFITAAAGHKGVHTELTTLVIPEKNDSEAEIRAAAEFIAAIDKNIPWHLSAYYPSYNYSKPPTNPDTLRQLAKIASEYLNFVFTGNISSGLSDTICPNCGSQLIKRSGYKTDTSGIISGKCSNCSADVSSYGILF